MRSVLIRAGLGTAVAAAGFASLAVPASAAGPSSLIFVSPTATTAGTDADCATASHTTVQSGVDDVTDGGTVVVCPGTYAERVSISKPYITLRGEGAAVIDATNQPYGVGIGADHVTVDGLTVKNAHADEATQAPGDGIVTAALTGATPTVGNDATITNNVATDNDGAGIDVQSSTGNTISGNRTVRNTGVGINVSNDLGGPSTGNVISNNVASGNAGGCGIVLADHSGSGVFGNLVVGNTASRNGLGTSTAPQGSSGSGIIIATPTPNGNVSNNVVRGNTFNRNGHGGVALHIHVAGADFSGIRIVGNTVGKNNLLDDYKDTDSTGIYLGSVEAVSIRVARNYIHNNVVGIFTAGDVTVKGKHTNAFVDVKRPFDSAKKFQ